jgi:hypothetical protein
MQLDALRKLPKDLTEPTFCGAIVSLICTCVLTILSATEVRNYLWPDVHSEMVF